MYCRFEMNEDDQGQTEVAIRVYLINYGKADHFEDSMIYRKAAWA